MCACALPQTSDAAQGAKGGSDTPPQPQHLDTTEASSAMMTSPARPPVAPNKPTLRRCARSGKNDVPRLAFLFSLVFPTFSLLVAPYRRSLHHTVRTTPSGAKICAKRCIKSEPCRMPCSLVSASCSDNPVAAQKSCRGACSNTFPIPPHAIRCISACAFAALPVAAYTRISGLQGVVTPSAPASLGPAADARRYSFSATPSHFAAAAGVGSRAAFTAQSLMSSAQARSPRVPSANKAPSTAADGRSRLLPSAKKLWLKYRQASSKSSRLQRSDRCCRRATIGSCVSPRSHLMRSSTRLKSAGRAERWHTARSDVYVRSSSRNQPPYSKRFKKRSAADSVVCHGTRHLALTSSTLHPQRESNTGSANSASRARRHSAAAAWSHGRMPSSASARHTTWRAACVAPPGTVARTCAKRRRTSPATSAKAKGHGPCGLGSVRPTTPPCAAKTRSCKKPRTGTACARSFAGTRRRKARSGP
eukprot:Rhum_TRINITY_DN4749_c0_g1::Rhum_TRINITY_DN4749_c0_g1_i1::g.15461::m.15461